MAKKSAIVIGAGILGLATARALASERIYRFCFRKKPKGAGCLGSKFWNGMAHWSAFR